MPDQSLSVYEHLAIDGAKHVYNLFREKGAEVSPEQIREICKAVVSLLARRSRNDMLTAIGAGLFVGAATGAATNAACRTLKPDPSRVERALQKVTDAKAEVKETGVSSHEFVVRRERGFFLSLPHLDVDNSSYSFFHTRRHREKRTQDRLQNREDVLASNSTVPPEAIKVIMETIASLRGELALQKAKVLKAEEKAEKTEEEVQKANAKTAEFSFPRALLTATVTATVTVGVMVVTIYLCDKE
jgi:hypothetical protein